MKFQKKNPSIAGKMEIPSSFFKRKANLNLQLPSEKNLNL
jgi:hypothetical protein